MCNRIPRKNIVTDRKANAGIRLRFVPSVLMFWQLWERAPGFLAMLVVFRLPLAEQLNHVLYRDENINQNFLAFTHPRLDLNKPLSCFTLLKVWE